MLFSFFHAWLTETANGWDSIYKYSKLLASTLCAKSDTRPTANAAYLLPICYFIIVVVVVFGGSVS